MQMKTRILIVSLIIFVFLVLSNPLIWVLFGSTHLRAKVIEQIVYKALISKLTLPSSSETEKMIELFDYVDTHVFHKTNMDDSPFHVDLLKPLIRGTGYCDEQAGTLIALAAKEKIKGRLLYLRGYDSVSHHTVCDLYIDGKFRIFDPDYGYIFFSDKEIATFFDIQKKGSKLSSEKIKALRYIKRDFDPSGYFRLYEPKHPFIVARTNYNVRFSKALRAKTIDFYYEIFGDRFLIYLQDLYFKLDDVDTFVRARIEHLSFRFQDALNNYNNIIEKNKDTLSRSEALFFKAQLFWDMKSYNNSISAFKRLLRIYSENRWIHEVYFYLGNSYENLSQFDKAKMYYSKIKLSQTTPAPTRLMHLLGN